MPRKIEIPIFKIREDNDSVILTITRVVSPFTYKKRYKSIITYQIFNNNYSIAIIGYDDEGLFFSIIETNGVFRTMTEHIAEKVDTEKHPLDKQKIDVRQQKLNPRSIYFIYPGVNDKYYIFDMQGYFGYIENVRGKFNLTVNNKGYYRHLSKELLDEILSLLLR